MSEINITYCIVEVFIIASVMIMLLRLNQDFGSEYETNALRRLLLCFLLLLVFDILWTFYNGGLFSYGQLTGAAVNIAYWISLSIGCYYWFLFITARLQPSRSFGKSARIIVTLPVAVSVCLNIISIYNGCTYNVVGTKVYNGPLTWVTEVVDYFYLLVPAIGSLIFAFTVKSKAKKHEFLTYACSMIVPIIAAVVELILPGSPVGVLSIFFVMFILFGMIQTSQINTDSLTGLNNRRRMDQYLEDRISAASAEDPLTIYIMDLNNFKSINDAFGHVEGDTALKLMANALKTAADTYDGFAAREGGDEFCLITTSSRYAPEAVERGIKMILNSKQEKISDRRYTLTLSLGSSRCTDPKCNIEAAIKEADEKMYEAKRRWHESND